MKIYTKTGDKGETSLFGGKRVSKDDLRIEAYGTVDELNSVIGICRSVNTISEIDAVLDEIQRDLFTLSADLATPLDSNRSDLQRIDGGDVTRLEEHIDGIDPKLEPLKNFILPGGSQSAAVLHFARTVCRRAERCVVRIAHQSKIAREPVIYLNRLSDLLFVLARWANVISKTPETKWRAS